MKRQSRYFQPRVANGVLVLAGVGFLLMFAASVWLRESHLAGKAHARYALSLGGAAFCFLSLRLKTKAKRRLALVTLSTAFSLYTIEAVLYLVPVSTVNVSGKFHEVLEARAKGIPAVPDIPPRLFLATGGFSVAGGRIFPLGGIANRTTVLCAEGGDYTVYESDEHGFHNPPGTHEIRGIEMALVGDSFIQGACVADGQDIAGHLRSRGRSVLGLGAMGAGPLIELALLTEYAAQRKPRTVFWCYFEGNDLSDLEREKESAFLLRYLNRKFSQGLKSKQAQINKALMGLMERHLAARAREEFFLKGPVSFLSLSHFRARVRLLTLKRSPDLRSEGVDPLLGDILREARDRTEAWGGKFYLVYLPAWERFARREKGFPKRQVLSLVKALGVRVIDIEDFFSQQADPLSFFPKQIFRHYTSEGYARIAEILQAAASVVNP